MSVDHQGTTEQALSDLDSIYEQFKQVAIWFGACAIVEQTSPLLEREIRSFDEDAHRFARRYAQTPYGSVFGSFAAAAIELRSVTGVLGGRAADALELADALRERHRTLRARVWELLPFEYVPCSSPAHQHEHHGGEHIHG